LFDGSSINQYSYISNTNTKCCVVSDVSSTHLCVVYGTLQIDYFTLYYYIALHLNWQCKLLLHTLPAVQCKQITCSQVYVSNYHHTCQRCYVWPLYRLYVCRSAVVYNFSQFFCGGGMRDYQQLIGFWWCSRS